VGRKYDLTPASQHAPASRLDDRGADRDDASARPARTEERSATEPEPRGLLRLGRPTRDVTAGAIAQPVDLNVARRQSMARRQRSLELADTCPCSRPWSPPPCPSPSPRRRRAGRPPSIIPKSRIGDLGVSAAPVRSRPDSSSQALQAFWSAAFSMWDARSIARSRVWSSHSSATDCPHARPRSVRPGTPRGPPIERCATSTRPMARGLAQRTPPPGAHGRQNGTSSSRSGRCSAAEPHRPRMVASGPTSTAMPLAAHHPTVGQPVLPVTPPR
jgi:hypothetical protein